MMSSILLVFFADDDDMAFKAPRQHAARRDSAFNDGPRFAIDGQVTAGTAKARWPSSAMLSNRRR